ncbi:hypothetical protein EAG_16216 [Camponotus floridanus]|uniref:Uncharacterized protein n=1 Tax=Camponotus floridanus TaxID=104421 RepID=E2AG44_CAMFO|nr:hypothetical protein EAG_16216 [Camponotus floridanus]
MENDNGISVCSSGTNASMSFCTRRDEWGRIFGDWVPATRLDPSRLSSANHGVTKITHPPSKPPPQLVVLLSMCARASQPHSAYFESVQDPLLSATIVADKKRRRKIGPDDRVAYEFLSITGRTSLSQTLRKFAHPTPFLSKSQVFSIPIRSQRDPSLEDFPGRGLRRNLLMEQDINLLLSVLSEGQGSKIVFRTSQNDATCTMNDARIIYNPYPEISCQCSNKRIEAKLSKLALPNERRREDVSPENPQTPVSSRQNFTYLLSLAGAETVSDTGIEQYLTPTTSLNLVLLLTSTSSILPCAFQSKQCTGCENLTNKVTFFVSGDGTFRTATATNNTRASKLVPDTVERIDQSAANRIPHLTTARGSTQASTTVLSMPGKAADSLSHGWHALRRDEKKGCCVSKGRGRSKGAMRHGTSATGAWPSVFVPQRAPTEEEGPLRQRKSMTYRQLPCTVTGKGKNDKKEMQRKCIMKGIRERVLLLRSSRIQEKPFQFASVSEMQKGVSQNTDVSGKRKKRLLEWKKNRIYREFSSRSKTLFSTLKGSLNSKSCQSPCSFVSEKVSLPLHSFGTEALLDKDFSRKGPSMMTQKLKYVQRRHPNESRNASNEWRTSNATGRKGRKGRLCAGRRRRTN